MLTVHTLFDDLWLNWLKSYDKLDPANFNFSKSVLEANVSIWSAIKENLLSTKQGLSHKEMPLVTEIINP